MIDLSTYRLRVGTYNATKKIKAQVAGKDEMYTSGTRIDITYRVMRFLVCYILYLYFILYFIAFSLSIIACAADDYDHNHLSYWAQPRVLSSNFGRDLPFLSVVHIKLGYFIVVSFVCKQFTCGLHLKFCKRYKMKDFSPANLFFGRNTTRVRQIVSILIIALLTLNFLLIAIVNPSLLNPGPQNLSVYYQNVQGLIPFSNLNDPHPMLNTTKILELNAYINDNKPALIMLTETWLKKSIKDNEVIESPDYIVYRNDRTQTSHPSDPNDPKKNQKIWWRCHDCDSI